MPLPDPIDAAESARRIRAAVAYDGRDDKDIAEAVGISPNTFRNYVSAARPTRLDLERRRQIAVECGVPPAFMEHGFAMPTESDDELRATVRRLAAQVARHEAQLRVLAVEERQRTETSAQTTKAPLKRQPA
jgi:transcriptional regulator with XRE-family HTH domain